MRRHLVLRVESHYQIFCRLLQEFVRRKTVTQPVDPTVFGSMLKVAMSWWMARQSRP